VANGIESAGVTETQQIGSEPVSQEHQEKAATPRKSPRGSRALRAGLSTAVALCLATALTHVALVFLHVAPLNAISQRYGQQNWKLFAPDPESVNRKISARTAHTALDGSVEVSAWFDLTAVDNSAVEHNVFPSHTTQNLLRRAWTSYVESHGGDDQPRSERAVMMQKYLRNIAADRVAAHNSGTFESIQLRVTTLPIAAPGTADGNRPASASQAPDDTRLLPWWKVTPHGN
jgi:hypothetical protein